jgi:hypothetical protein
MLGNKLELRGCLNGAWLPGSYVSASLLCGCLAALWLPRQLYCMLAWKLRGMPCNSVIVWQLCGCLQSWLLGICVAACGCVVTLQSCGCPAVVWLPGSRVVA